MDQQHYIIKAVFLNKNYENVIVLFKNVNKKTRKTN